MKKLMLLAAILAIVLVAAAPAIAELENAFDDQELESGEISTETDISIEGNNNNQCTGLLQFGQSGNFANQQGTTQYDNPELEQEFAGPEYEFAPENETACEQAVQQSAAASSWGW
jgi:predicted Zn-dependent protease